MSPRFAGSVAAVTGGGSGIGEACCRRLASEGANVAVIDLNAQAAERVAAAIRDGGGAAFAVQGDVADANAIAAALEQVVATAGRIDLAVNNAGIAADTDLVEDDLALWHRLIGINLSGVYFSMLAERRLIRPEGGVIVNIASILGVVGYQGAGGYAASKHGVIGLTKSAAITWAPENIRVNAVCPGFVRTPLMEAATNEQWAQILAAHPLGRLPTAADIAAAVVYLGSNDAASVTGAVHMVDAGYTAR
ncbi:MAG: SDR family oxidoreductase [Novosphingobium sp.]